MAGVKGKSGRKSNYQIARDGNLLDLCNTWLLDNFNSFDTKTKIRVAVEISKRGVQQNHNVTGEIKFTAEEAMAARQRLNAIYN